MSCLHYSVLMTRYVAEIDNTWLIIGFIIGFLIGLIGGAIVTFILLRRYLNKKKPEDEEGLEDGDDAYDEAGDVNEYNADGTFFSVETLGGKKGKRKKKKAPQKGAQEKEIHLEDYGIIPTSAIYEGADDSDKRRRKHLPGRRGLMDALLKPNGESADLELASQELDFISLLEKEIRDGKVLNINQLIKMLLAHFAQNGALSPEFYKQFADEVREAIVAILKQLQDEQIEEERKLDEDKNLRNDPVAMEKAKEEMKAKYALKMDSLLSQEQQNIRTKLVTRTELSEEEVDTAITKLNAGLTAFEAKTSDHLQQQKKTLEERVMRRKMISQMRQNKQQEEKEQIQSSIEHYEDAVGRLVSDGLLADRQAAELLSEYKQTLRNIQNKYEQDNRRQMELLSAKFQERRVEQITALENELKNETEELLLAYDGKTDMNGYIKSYNRMKEEHQERLDNLVDELDQQELVENGKMKKPLLAERKAGIKAADGHLAETLRVKYRLEEDDVMAMIDEHKTRMNQFEARKKQERKMLENAMSIRLAERMKSLDEPPAPDSFQEALKDRQEQVIKEVLTVQPDLDEEARKKILLQHEQNVRTLDNEIAMSKMKQQKILEARLAEKRARVRDLEEKKAKAETDGLKKELDKLEEQLADETVSFEKEKAKAEAEVRQRLQREADNALKAQELEMSKLIGRLQVRKARRQAILAQQDKTLQGLQDRLANEGSINLPEQILQQHYNDLAFVQQRIQSDRLQQEAYVKDQIEAKKYQKERELQAKVSESRLRAGSQATSSVFARMMIDQQQRKVTEEMEREMKLELQKQKVEMDREFEKELQDSLNDLNTNLVMQLAAVSNMSKNDIKNMVEDAVADTGGDSKKAKTLTRRLTLGVERAKTSLGVVSKFNKKKGGRAKSSIGFQNRAYSEDDVDDDDDDYDRGDRRRRRRSVDEDDDEDDYDRRRSVQEDEDSDYE